MLLVWKRQGRERFLNRYEVRFVENDLTFQPPRQGLPSKTSKKSPKIQKCLKNIKQKYLRRSRSTIGGGRGCHKSVSILGGDGTKIALPDYLFDEPPGEMI